MVRILWFLAKNTSESLVTLTKNKAPFPPTYTPGTHRRRARQVGQACVFQMLPVILTGVLGEEPGSMTEMPTAYSGLSRRFPSGSRLTFLRKACLWFCRSLEFSELMDRVIVLAYSVLVTGNIYRTLTIAGCWDWSFMSQQP